MTPVHYGDSPVVEALVEFQFGFAVPPDATLPGVLFSLLRDVYPEKRQVVGWGVVPPGTEDGQAGPGIKMDQRTRFLSPDGSQMIQVGGSVLAVNVLAPYPGWAEFKPQIVRALACYLGEFAPISIKRVGLRYVNHIELGGELIELKDYFRIYPQTPEGSAIGPDHGNFAMKIEASPVNGDQLRVGFGTDEVPQEPGKARFLLDIDYSSTQLATEAPALSSVEAWLETAHGCVEDTFEACLTATLQETLGRTESK